uniref:DRBM domain-containing protein n=1 Tax=Oryza glaberrima TaxID=4538 RepID=I1QQE5_ORYGL
MEVERRGGGEVNGVVEMEDAVGILVDYLVRPALRKGSRMTPENQADVARQVHMAVILYNYYHRKQFPQLAFADAMRFFKCASLTLGDSLLAYSNMVHQHEKSSGSPGEGVNLSVTDKAVVDACGIAEALDANQDSPDMAMWPISKVAVLLLDSTRKRCLLESGSVGKNVRSLLEKEIDTSSTSEHGSNKPEGQDLENEETGPYVLQKLAFSEVERRTEIKRSSLRLLDEHLAYSLTKKGTTTKLFILEYEQTAKGNFAEMPIEELIKSYLCMKEVCCRKWHFDSSLSMPKEETRRNGKSSSHSEIDENSKEQEYNIKGSTQKKIKRDIKVLGSSDKNYSCTSRNKRSSNVNSKRKSEVFRATAADGAEGLDSEIPRVKNALPPVVDVSTMKFVSCSVNAKETAAANAGFVDMEADFHQGGSAKDNKDLKFASFKSYLKKRDDLHRKQRMIEDETVQFDMDIQSVFAGGEWTPEAMSLLEKYGILVDSLDMVEVNGSSYSGDGYETLTIERKKLTVERLLRNKCQLMQELDEVCRENNWILPRYKVMPSLTDGMYVANVDIACLEFSQMTFGDPKTNPRDARESAAANLLAELLKKADANREHT